MDNSIEKVILPTESPCGQCEGVWKPIHWQTIDMNGLTVHNVPVYVCPKCGHETISLQVCVVYDRQVALAYSQGLTEITLTLPNLTLRPIGEAH